MVITCISDSVVGCNILSDGDIDGEDIDGCWLVGVSVVRSFNGAIDGSLIGTFDGDIVGEEDINGCCLDDVYVVRLFDDAGDGYMVGPFDGVNVGKLLGDAVEG